MQINKNQLLESVISSNLIGESESQVSLNWIIFKVALGVSPGFFQFNSSTKS